jgi:hypothetical protein
MDITQSGIAPELKEKQPGSEKDKEKGLVWQLFPDFKKFDTEFLENSVIAGWTGRLRVYSSLFDT